MTAQTTTSKHISFDGQRDGEELLFVFRRHPATMRKGLIALFICLAITITPSLLWHGESELLWLPVAGGLAGLLLFGYHFILWYFTYYLVTSQRIRQVTQKGLFGHSVIELQLSKIQNISYTIPGFLGEIFGFGTIIIQTLAGDLVIHKISHPGKIYNKLQDAVLRSNAVHQEDNQEIETTVQA